ncbi:MAG: DUF6476 family protein [Pseudomonadota bacterium]
MSAPMDDEDLPEPPQVRRLRLLVTVLTVVSILGVVAVVALLVIRLLMVPTPTAPAAGVSRVSADVAERLVLPAGERIVAVGAAGPVLLIATEDAAGQERLRRFDASSGAALGVTQVERE